MLKKLIVWGVVAVAIVVAVQVLLRNGPPAPSLFTPPKMRLPALDPPKREPSETADPAAVAAVQAERLYAETAPRKFQRRLMFDCGDVRIFIRIGEGEAALLPESSLTGHWIPLTSAGSAWRGRYANEDLVFRPAGDRATFVLGDDTLENCVATRDRGAMAEVNGGVYFQAFGANPNWTFEIAEYALMLTTDGGARRIEIPLRAPTDNGARMTFRSVA